MNKILIIEDEISIAELERDYLEIAGYMVDIENNGNSGLNKALSEEYKLIILDIMLPDINGFSICREIRTKKDTPILFVSAKSEDIDIIRGLGLGADDYITKPFNMGELVARVNAHIARYERLISKQPQEDIIFIRDLKIDIPAHQVFIKNNQIPLTIKEFELLVFLSKNIGHVFSKEKLFDEIWSMESFGDVSTVTVHIKNLRDKIEKDSSKPEYIETVWGAGYRMKG